MMDVLFSVNTVFPLLLIMAVGYGVRRLGWMGDSALRQMNQCVFGLFLPLLLFFNIMDTSRSATIDGKTLLFGFVGSLAVFLLMFCIAPLLCKERRARGSLIQGIARSNYAIFGIPLVMMMYPEADTSMAALMVAVVVPVFNVMSTVALMVYGNERTTPWQVAKGVLTNPLIISTALALVLWQLGISLPPLLEKPLRQMGSITTPLALFLLGVSLDFAKVRANARLLTIGVVGRLVAVPLVFLSLAIAMGIRDVSLATLIAVFASPTAVSSYPMAQKMGCDDELAGALVVFTTVFCVITVFLWVLVLRAMGFLA